MEKEQLQINLAALDVQEKALVQQEANIALQRLRIEAARKALMETPK